MICAAPLGRDRRQALVRVVARQAERDDGDAPDARVLGGQIVDRLAQNFAVVDSGAEHDLRVNLDAGVHHPAHLVGDVGALFVNAEQVGAHLQIGRVDGDVLRRESLLDDARASRPR